MRPLAFLLCLLSAPCYAGQIGIIIGTDSGSLRRVIMPDNDAQLHKQNWAGPGETMIVADQSAEITAEITKFTGKPPRILLAAVVNKAGKVISVMMADSALDKSADGQLVPAFPGVAVGQVYNSVRHIFVVPARGKVPAYNLPVLPLELEPPHRLVPAK